MTHEEKRQRAYYRVAWNIKHMWDEGGTSDTRLLERPLISDAFVVVGESEAGTGRREHIVPRKVLCSEAHKMFAEGASIEEVAELLERFLKVVLITREEQRYMDSAAGLGLRQRMPEGWNFNDGDSLARLNAAEIKVKLY
ncbi:hypothetical protein [Alteromonas stellipolaris]|uniref:hypothetical protein n=1 Tax=Alteromonas stellipolaris TaxID=233316 RepID=UPI0026E296A5|nr:hypothetical protein [Alteromonas stellipolaris]MDO6536248.1 hypothetical protein [Alteromonas stellipolaris]MDO6627783.1 hypothetical protein [Alteromonas stellipolaris]